MFAFHSCESDDVSPEQEMEWVIFFNGECGQLFTAGFLNSEGKRENGAALPGNHHLQFYPDNTYVLQYDYTYSVDGIIKDTYSRDENGTFSYTYTYHPAIWEEVVPGFNRFISASYWNGNITFSPKDNQTWTANYVLDTFSKRLFIPVDNGTLSLGLRECYNFMEMPIEE